jgi:hypothetical protein
LPPSSVTAYLSSMRLGLERDPLESIKLIYHTACRDTSVFLATIGSMLGPTLVCRHVVLGCEHGVAPLISFLVFPRLVGSERNTCLYASRRAETKASNPAALGGAPHLMICHFSFDCSARYPVYSPVVCFSSRCVYLVCADAQGGVALDWRWWPRTCGFAFSIGAS